MVSYKGRKKSINIIPEIGENLGWDDYAEKILRFIEKGGINNDQSNNKIQSKRKFARVAHIKG